MCINICAYVPTVGLALRRVVLLSEALTNNNVHAQIRIHTYAYTYTYIFLVAVYIYIHLFILAEPDLGAAVEPFAAARLSGTAAAHVRERRRAAIPGEDRWIDTYMCVYMYIYMYVDMYIYLHACEHICMNALREAVSPSSLPPSIVPICPYVYISNPI
jgi:hypothetical protein